MIESAILLDAAVVGHALGIQSRWCKSCQNLLRLIEQGQFHAYASVEMVQEVVHHRLRRTGHRAKSVRQARDISALCTLLTFDREILDLSLDLIKRIPAIRSRDAVHAATALAYCIERIVSPDDAFGAILGLTRIDPAEFA